VQHLYSNVVEQTIGYYPPPCELEKIVNETIAFCDPLDGKIDGVVARSDLCKLKFNVNSTIGKPYSCAASSGMAGFMGPPGGGPPKSKRQFPNFSPSPAQNGTVTAKGAAVAAEINNGLRDSKGRRVYLSYQPAAGFEDAKTQYNSVTKSWGLSVNGMGAEFVTRYLQLLNTSSMPNLDGVTYDTLKDWIYQGMQTYENTLQTTWPDLTPFHEAGGKVANQTTASLPHRRYVITSPFVA
jgi:tannase